MASGRFLDGTRRPRPGFASRSVGMASTRGVCVFACGALVWLRIVRVDEILIGAGGGTRTPTSIFSPTDFLTNYGFHRRHEAFVVWTIPSPWLKRFRCCPSSLYTFPSPGLARDCHVKGFPEFEQFCICGFPQSTHGRLKSVASTNSATPAYRLRLILVRLVITKKKLTLISPDLLPCLFSARYQASSCFALFGGY
jgi:hypothetical protein